MKQEMTIKTWAILLLTAGLSGSSFFFIKLIVGSIPPLTLSTVRTAIAAIVVYGFMRMNGHALPRFGPIWMTLIILGLLTSAIPYAMIAWGQVLIDSSIGGILFATIPVYTVLIAPLFLVEEKFTKESLLGVTIGFIGVVLIVGPEVLGGLSVQVMGASITLIAALSYAIGSIYARKQTDLSVLVMSTGQLIMAALFLGLLSLIIDKPWTLTPTLPVMLNLGFIGIFCTALTVLMFFWLVRNAGATNTSLLAFFIPIAAVILGVAALGEKLSLDDWVGFGFILIGAIMVTENMKRLYKRVTIRINQW